MKKWLLQTSTLGGLIGLALAGITAIQSGMTPLNVAGAVLSALLLLVNDGKFLKGLTPLFFVGLLAGSVSSCAGMQLPSDITASTAENVACNALYQSDCFGDVLASVGINHGTCAADIDAMINGKVQIDFSKLKGLPKACKSELKTVQEYIDTAQSAVNNAAGVK
jgi:hypothetical protein